jgi:hypothetical protein
MNSEGSVDPRVLFGEGNCAGYVVRAVTVANGKEGTNTSVIGALNGGIAIRCELGTVKMSVGV